MDEISFRRGHPSGTDERPLSMVFTDDSNDEEHEEPAGNYSTRMDELLDDEFDPNAEESDEEEFIYPGAVIETTATNYRDQLKHVLGADHEEDEADEIHEGEQSLVIERDMKGPSYEDDEPLARSNLSRNSHDTDLEVTAAVRPRAF